MPTHIVIRERPAQRRDHALAGGCQSDTGSTVEAAVDHLSPTTLTRGKTPIKGVVGFRKSVSAKKVPVQKPAAFRAKRDMSYLHLSRNDIRASPRLPGYLYMLVASMVMLVSSVKFFVERDDDAIKEVRRLEDVEQDSDFTATFGFVVSTWKLYGAIAVSGAGTGISLFVICVHFDFKCLPKLWKAFFRDGSKMELYLLYSLLIFWIAGLQICTSSFSVGESAPNVYFTCWIGFASVCINLGVWRASAEQPTLADRLWSHERETMHNWFFVWMFAMINSLGVADLYANRNETQYEIAGEVKEIPQGTWNKALTITLTCSAVSFLTMLANQYLTKPFRFKVCCGGKINLDWRQFEGFLALAFVGTYYWIIVEYTGVNFPLNGPSNAYFGAWGVFFSAILTFGSWLHENKHIEIFISDRNQAKAEQNVAVPPTDTQS